MYVWVYARVSKETGRLVCVCVCVCVCERERERERERDRDRDRDRDRVIERESVCVYQ